MGEFLASPSAVHVAAPVPEGAMRWYGGKEEEQRERRREGRDWDCESDWEGRDWDWDCKIKGERSRVPM
jgi:hypothetical protein